jgi:hypothetical protein
VSSTATKSRRLPGRPPKHGARALERFLKQNRADGRSKLAIARQDVANGLAEDRGGWPRLSNAEAILVRHAADLVLLTDTIAHYVLRSGTPFGPDGDLLPVLKRSFIGYSNCLRRALAELGLRAVASEPQSLAEYLRARESASRAQSGPQSDAAVEARVIDPGEDTDS